MIQAITFDLDGVYFPDGKARFIEALRQSGVTEKAAKAVFLESPEMTERYKNGLLTDDEFWTWAAAQWQINKSPHELISLLVSGYSVDRKVQNVVRAARQHGYKALVCSNNFPARVHGLQQKFGFLDDFDAAVFSYEVGASKPDQKIFQELIRRAKVDPQAIVFADDNPANLAGAAALGITTFLYEGFDSFIAKLQSLGVKLSR